MERSIRHVSTVLIKSLFAIAVLLVLVVVGFLAYMEFKSRPPGSPPPGYEDRVKYNQVSVPGPFSSKTVPVDLWFGKHGNRYDTTHMRIDSDYFALRPQYHGEAAHINTIWPSLLSIRDYKNDREMSGLPYERNKEFTIMIAENRSGFGTDENGSESTQPCEPVIRDDVRGVKYCNVNNYNDKPGERWIYYWPIDENIRTPRYNNSPRFSCKIIEQKREKGFDACGINFSYNDDIYVWMEFVPEQLALDILVDFPRLIEFLNTLEVES